MQSILQLLLSRLTADYLQLIFTTGFESAGVVQDVTCVIFEDELVLDAMLATQQDSYDEPSRTSDLFCRVE
jgi:hypothetical protein